jgi:hypothetical protein
MGCLISIVFGLIFGTVCAFIANSKGRNEVGWFFFGFGAGLFVIFGVIPLIMVAAMDNLKATAAREEELRQQNRRLKEQIRKDRMVADQRHVMVEDRLRAHDRVLNLDTERPEGKQRNLIDADENDDDDEEPTPRPRRRNPDV